MASRRSRRRINKSTPNERLSLYGLLSRARPTAYGPPAQRGVICSARTHTNRQHFISQFARFRPTAKVVAEILSATLSVRANERARVHNSERASERPFITRSLRAQTQLRAHVRSCAIHVRLHEAPARPTEWTDLETGGGADCLPPPLQNSNWFT